MTPQGHVRTRTWRTAALIVIVLACTVLGGWRASNIMAGKPGPATLVVKGVSYTVAYAEQVKGLSDADLGGMSHGVQSLVTDDKALVKVMLIITAGDSPASYDPSALRAIATGSSVAVAPVGGTLAPGRLSAHGRMEGSLSFVFARNGAQLTLRAPGDAREVRLLQVDNAPAGAGQHQHPTATPAAKPVTTKPAAKPVTTKPVTTKPAAKPVTTEPAAKRVTTKPAAQRVTSTRPAKSVTTTPVEKSGKGAPDHPAQAPRPTETPLPTGKGDPHDR